MDDFGLLYYVAKPVNDDRKMQQAFVQSAGYVRKTTGFKKVIKPKGPQIIVSMCVGLAI